MSLHQMAFAFDAEHASGVDVDLKVTEHAQLLNTWGMQHKSLDGWMAELYKRKANSAPSFSGFTVRLNEQDVLWLNDDVVWGRLAAYGGYFYDKQDEDQAWGFAVEAGTALCDGYAVAFVSQYPPCVSQQHSYSISQHMEGLALGTVN